MADDSFTYCDSEEEVFIGKVTEKELLKMALHKQYFSSSNESTPQKQNLPDVLNGSTSLAASASAGEVTKQSEVEDDDVLQIDLSSADNSVQVLSDDESFLLNEKLVERNYNSAVKESDDLNKSFKTLHVSCTKEDNCVKIDGDIALDIETNYIVSDSNQYEPSAVHPQDEGNMELHNSTIETDEEDANKTANNIFQHKFDPAKEVDCTHTDSNENSQADETLVSDSLEQNCISVKSDKDHVCSDNRSEMPSDVSAKMEQPTLNETEYISINGISDSVLNVSQGSSVSSPSVPVATKNTERSLLSNVIYEDISFDYPSETESTNLSARNDDLHMSVDEPDYQQTLSIGESDSDVRNISTFKHDFDKYSMSSYYTATTNSENLSTKPSTDTFYSYREPLNDTVGLDEVNEPQNETSFEIVVQNRQNSFVSSSTSSDVKVTSKTEETKQKPQSKLPLFIHGPKSLIQPPKLNVPAPKLLDAHNYKWAKHTLTQDPKRMKLSKGVDVKYKLTTNNGKNVQTLQNKEGPQTNIPKSAYKTPGKTISYQASRILKSESNTSYESSDVLKSDSKTSHLTISSTKSTKSSEKSMRSRINSPFGTQGKHRFRNIVSPVQAYIYGSPTVLQERKDVSEEIKAAVGGVFEKTSHLPIKIKTEPTASSIVKKLEYEKKRDRENHDPNYSRDTLPPKCLQNSEAVFMKEPEPPKKCLPKMGQRLQKLLDTPRPKLVVHQGRVNNSPNAKGVLFPMTDPNSSVHNLDSPSGRVSVRVVKNVDNSNELTQK